MPIQMGATVQVKIPARFTNFKFIGVVIARTQVTITVTAIPFIHVNISIPS
jgi:hypothetical protein